jgi:hypothetical protein
MMVESRDAVNEYAAALNVITSRVDASLKRASALPAVDFPAPPLWTAAIVAEMEEWRALQAEASRLMAPEVARGVQVRALRWLAMLGVDQWAFLGVDSMESMMDAIFTKVRSPRSSRAPIIPGFASAGGGGSVVNHGDTHTTYVIDGQSFAPQGVDEERAFALVGERMRQRAFAEAG